MDVRPKLETCDAQHLAREVSRMDGEIQRLRGKMQEAQARLDAARLKNIQSTGKMEDSKPPISMHAPEMGCSGTSCGREKNVIEISDDEAEIENKPKLQTTALNILTVSSQQSSVSIDASQVTKRKREIMNCVLVPLPAQSFKRPRELLPAYSSMFLESSDDSKPVHSSRKILPTLSLGTSHHIPKAKKEEVQVNLSSAAKAHFLGGLSPLKILPSPRETLLSRKTLNAKLGGSTQQLRAKFSKHHDRRWAIFATPELNPYAPTRPGDHGLMCSVSLNMCTDDTYYMFSRRMVQKHAVWCYVGDVICTVSGGLTAEQFESQSQEFKDEWGGKILKRTDVPSVEMRARISLRKRRLPIDDAAVAAERQQMEDKAGTLTTVDVVQALKRGEEHIQVVRMKCVSYDHLFAAQLAGYLEEDDGKKDKPKGAINRRKGGNSS
ncbi:hypothetical protein C8J57DRAFT_1710631 [Mycena rebaudengoi]|nr:hypothetical protein C8J57DRAFT_1710631 [Mycena rebaudengoi]